MPAMRHATNPCLAVAAAHGDCFPSARSAHVALSPTPRAPPRRTRRCNNAGLGHTRHKHECNTTALEAAECVAMRNDGRCVVHAAATISRCDTDASRKAEVAPSAQAFILLALPTGERDVRRLALTLAKAGTEERSIAGEMLRIQRKDVLVHIHPHIYALQQQTSKSQSASVLPCRIPTTLRRLGDQLRC